MTPGTDVLPRSFLLNKESDMNKWPDFLKYSQALVLDWRELMQFYYDVYP